MFGRGEGKQRAKSRTKKTRTPKSKGKRAPEKRRSRRQKSNSQKQPVNTITHTKAMENTSSRMTPARDPLPARVGAMRIKKTPRRSITPVDVCKKEK